ncbi:MAG: hypothetical protein K0R83_1451 [Caulobacter sp.]|nr:hypothetical protein [Caulobacter sp.]
MDVPLPSVSMTVQLTSEPLFKERPELILPWAVASADQPSTYLTRHAERLRTPFDVTRGDIIREKSS